MPALPHYPWPESATPTRVLNNVLIADRDNEFGREKARTGRGNTNAAIKWSGCECDKPALAHFLSRPPGLTLLRWLSCADTPAIFEKNVIVINATAAPSRDGWFGGRQCATDELPPAATSPHCTLDTFGNFADSSLSHNLYHNMTSAFPGTVLSSTFPGGCAATALGACVAKPPGRTAFNGGCSCRSFEQWQTVGEDAGSLRVDPELQGKLRLVSASKALALGIEPLTELETAGPDWSQEE